MKKTMVMVPLIVMVLGFVSCKSGKHVVKDSVDSTTVIYQDENVTIIDADYFDEDGDRHFRSKKVRN